MLAAKENRSKICAELVLFGADINLMYNVRKCLLTHFHCHLVPPPAPSPAPPAPPSLPSPPLLLVLFLMLLVIVIVVVVVVVLSSSLSWHIQLSAAISLFVLLNDFCRVTREEKLP